MQLNGDYYWPQQLAPDISGVSLLRVHFLQILLRFGFGHVAFVFDYVKQNVTHIVGHVFRISEKKFELIFGNDEKMRLKHTRICKDVHFARQLFSTLNPNLLEVNSSRTPSALDPGKRPFAVSMSCLAHICQVPREKIK